MTITFFSGHLRMARLGLFLILVLMLAGCDKLSGKPLTPEEQVRKAYTKYSKAIQSKDTRSMHRLVVKKRASSFEGPDAAGNLELIKQLYPVEVTILKTEFQGDTATLTLFGREIKGSSEGSAILVKEDGEWRVDREEWTVRAQRKARGQKASSQPTPLQ